MDENKHDLLKISMLGGFMIEYGDKRLAVDSSRTKQVWSLLEYLICHRFVEISVDKFIEILWPSEEIDNPINALKNLVYRLRILLNQFGRTSEREYVLFKRGTYGWNNEIVCVVDTEEMERLIKLGSNTLLDTDMRANYYMQAIALYRGEFLSSAVYDEWPTSIRTYYRKLYIDCVLKLCMLLTDLNRHQDIETICSKAISFEPLEESIHEYLITALIKRNKQGKALEHYNYVSELFYKELGINVSQKLRDIYRDVLISFKKAETDVTIITKELREQDKVHGAFLCDYEIFKNIYRMMARSVARTGQRAYIGLLTVTGEKGDLTDERYREYTLDILRDVSVSSLRKGDVVSRYSATQYMVLFLTPNKENAQLVIDRIDTAFNERFDGEMAVKLDTKIFPVEAIV